MTSQSIRDSSRSALQTAQGLLTYYRLSHLEEVGLGRLERLPFSIRILLENALRHVDGYLVTEDDVANAASVE